VLHTKRQGRSRVACPLQTVLGPWIKFQSADALERALRYLGATDEQIEEHRQTMQQTGQDTDPPPISPKFSKPRSKSARFAY
jgi:hypothetical protein